jgi:hypothetical protein
VSIQNLKHNIRSGLSTRTWGLSVLTLSGDNRKLAVRRDTDIVIEGFPRCANTFAVVAFRQAQSREIRIAHHLHASAQIMVAERRGTPAILLIREPLDAIISLKIRHPELDTRLCLRDYQVFYGSLEPIMRYPAIADFSVVTNNLAAVIREVNRRFGTDFAEFRSTPEAIEAVFYEIDSIRRAADRSVLQIATPNEKKNAQKIQMRDAILRDLDRHELERADNICRRFMNLKLEPGQPA